MAPNICGWRNGRFLYIKMNPARRKTFAAILTDYRNFYISKETHTF